jgi:hypothetical protein
VLGQQLETTEPRAKQRSADLGIIEGNKSAILRAAGKETEAGLQKLQEDLSASQAQVTKVAVSATIAGSIVRLSCCKLQDLTTLI